MRCATVQLRAAHAAAVLVAALRGGARPLAPGSAVRPPRPRPRAGGRRKTLPREFAAARPRRSRAEVSSARG
eukprot:5472030-Pyramimonas_sp.AAC.1